MAETAYHGVGCGCGGGSKGMLAGAVTWYYILPFYPPIITDVAGTPVNNLS